MFYDCDALTDVTLPLGITEIGESAFEHCDAIEYIDLPYYVERVGDFAFRNCVSLKNVTMLRRAEDFGVGLFSYPGRMTISGISGTTAEQYAVDNGYTFIALDTHAESVEFATPEITVNRGEEIRLPLIISPDVFVDEITWKSTNTEVAEISETGVINLWNPGTATIRVTVGSLTASCKITVVQAVEYINIWGETELDALGTYEFYADVYPWDADDTSVTWSSSDPSVATVDENGLVTAVAKGTAKITATANDGSGVYGSCTVTVNNNAYIAGSTDDLESGHDYPNGSSDFWIYTVPGAALLNVTFDERTCVEDPFDVIRIFDGEGNLVGEYTGDELAGQTVTVEGDTVKIQLVSDEGGTAWGFKVTSVIAGSAGLIGDANGDGEISNSDALAIFRYIFNPSQYALDVSAADVDHDGEITNGDALAIFRYIFNPELYPLK